MSTRLQTQSVGTKMLKSLFTPVMPGLLQRKCACGTHTMGGGQCADCQKKQVNGQPLETKLAISEPGDAYEQEADRVAEQVMRMPESATTKRQHNSMTLSLVQRRTSGDVSGVVEAPATVHDVLNSQGQPLDATTRAFFEPRFAQDFSQVRLHTDSKAQKSARAVDALAYTVGRDVVMADPHSVFDRSLLAHELAHVVQQQGVTSSIIRRKPAAEIELPASDRCEESVNITDDFRAFLREVPNLLKSTSGFNDEQRGDYSREAQRVFGKEGLFDWSAYRVFSCKKIHLSLGSGDFSAYVDSDAKEIGLSRFVAERIGAFKNDSDPEERRRALLILLQTLAHEKRHVTLGSSIKVDPKDLKEGRAEPAAGRAAYHAEEILAIAEEIAIGRMAEGKSFAADTDVQLRIRRQWNQLRSFVTDVEAQRLRTLIIQKLRERYGFEDKCDTSITLGVMMSMEHNRWFECDGAGIITSKIPDGLTICQGKKGHRYCGSESVPADAATTKK